MEMLINFFKKILGLDKLDYRLRRLERAKAAEGGYMGSFIRLNVDGKAIGNPSLKKYYKGMI